MSQITSALALADKAWTNRRREVQHLPQVGCPPFCLQTFDNLHARIGIMRVHAVDDEEAAAFSLAQWLRGVRDRRGMSQESVAHSADLAVSTYSRLERSTLSKKTANPTLATFVRICVALGVTVDELGELADPCATSPSGPTPLRD